MTRAEILETSIPVPLENRYGRFELTSFRIREGARVATHLALSAGPPHDGQPVRVTSACVTSEVFGCDRCDCRRQLEQALSLFGRSGGGLLTYHPPEEGRGAGLHDKVRSFATMDGEGVDSRAAFRSLGLPEDSRTFGAAAAIVRHYDLGSVLLLTAAESKARALRAVGITVRTHASSTTSFRVVGQVCLWVLVIVAVGDRGICGERAG